MDTVIEAVKFVECKNRKERGFEVGFVTLVWNHAVKTNPTRTIPLELFHLDSLKEIQKLYKSFSSGWKDY